MDDLNKQDSLFEEETIAPWIDISVPIYSGMAHWPDNPVVRIERMQDMARGDAANVSKIEMGAHTGTHMDAPRHFLADGGGIDEMPLDATLGLARVIRIDHPHAILPAELEGHNLQPGERVLFRTQNSERCWNTDQFVDDFVNISAAAAHFLVDRQVMCMMALKRIRFSSAQGFGSSKGSTWLPWNPEFVS